MTAPAFLIDTLDPAEPATVTKIHRAWSQLRAERDRRVNAMPDTSEGDDECARVTDAYDEVLDALLGRAADLYAANYRELAVKASFLTADLHHTVLDVQGPVMRVLCSMERDALVLAEAARVVTWGEEGEAA